MSAGDCRDVMVRRRVKAVCTVAWSNVPHREVKRRCSTTRVSQNGAFEGGGGIKIANKKGQRGNDACVCASAFSVHGDLATYALPGHGKHEHVRPVPWFQGAIEEIVRHLQSSPFVQVVKLGNNPSVAEDLTTYRISHADGVATNVWGTIADSIHCETADAVILVQKITDSSDLQALDVEPSDVSVNEACGKLISSGVGQSILRGRVGECCDSTVDPVSTDMNDNDDTVVVMGGEQLRVGLPLAASARPSVKVAALPRGRASESPAPFHGYWGVVVQSKCRTGVEGCYLLKAGRSVVQGECSCSHFSLTRLSQNGDIHQQFIDNWSV